MKAGSAPALRDAAERLAERARTESWTHTEYLVACLQREVSARDFHGGEGRIRAARVPAPQDHRGARSDPAKENAVFLGPPGTGKTHLATGLAVRACQAGHRVAFATASQWVDRLAAAHQTGRLQDELVKLGRYPLIVIDEVGYIPFEAEAANLFFQLVSNRYERASLIVTSNKHIAFHQAKDADHADWQREVACPTPAGVLVPDGVVLLADGSSAFVEIDRTMSYARLVAEPERYAAYRNVPASGGGNAARAPRSHWQETYAGRSKKPALPAGAVRLRPRPAPRRAAPATMEAGFHERDRRVSVVSYRLTVATTTCISSPGRSPISRCGGLLATASTARP